MNPQEFHCSRCSVPSCQYSGLLLSSLIGFVWLFCIVNQTVKSEDHIMDIKRVCVSLSMAQVDKKMIDNMINTQDIH